MSYKRYINVLPVLNGENGWCNGSPTMAIKTNIQVVSLYEPSQVLKELPTGFAHTLSTVRECLAQTLIIKAYEEGRKDIEFYSARVYAIEPLRKSLSIPLRPGVRKKALKTELREKIRLLLIEQPWLVEEMIAYYVRHGMDKERAKVHVLNILIKVDGEP